ncbi:hypothetical protein BS17DRAFT_779086 [Gyrodon lividus]|nr:hypothetical protein BS17DRAFT_779086 [Gyrodon lividus]
MSGPTSGRYFIVPTFLFQPSPGVGTDLLLGGTEKSVVFDPKLQVVSPYYHPIIYWPSWLPPYLHIPVSHHSFPSHFMWTWLTECFSFDDLLVLVDRGRIRARKVQDYPRRVVQRRRSRQRYCEGEPASWSSLVDSPVSAGREQIPDRA